MARVTHVRDWVGSPDVPERSVDGQTKHHYARPTIGRRPSISVSRTNFSILSLPRLFTTSEHIPCYTSSYSYSTTTHHFQNRNNIMFTKSVLLVVLATIAATSAFAPCMQLVSCES